MKKEPKRPRSITPGFERAHGLDEQVSEDAMNTPQRRLGVRPDIDAAIEKLTGPQKLLARKEIKKLPEILWEGEKVSLVSQGRYSGKQGLVILTDRRLIFADMGLMRARVEDFPFEKISSVQHSTGIAFGKLTIYASGNKAEIDQIAPKDQAVLLADTLRSRLAAKAETSGQSSLRSEPDVMDQLKKLGELRDAGILTPEEFETKKAELLKRL